MYDISFVADPSAMASYSSLELLNKLDNLLSATPSLEVYSAHGPEYTEQRDGMRKVIGTEATLFSTMTPKLLLSL